MAGPRATTPRAAALRGAPRPGLGGPSDPAGWVYPEAPPQASGHPTIRLVPTTAADLAADRRRRRRLGDGAVAAWIVAAALWLAAALTGALGGPGVAPFPGGAGGPWDAPAAAGPAPAVPAPAGPVDWERALAGVRPGIVDVDVHLPEGDGAGTGMVVRPDGVVVTNSHVVLGADRIEVTVATTGERFAARVVGGDDAADIAVLQLDGAHGLDTVPLGDPSTLAVGDPVAALGNAGGHGGAPVVATGSVLGLHDTITPADPDGRGSRTLRDVVHVDAAVRPGHSGGALATADGRVVGMLAAASTTDWAGGAAGLGTTGSDGYAIRLDRVLAVVDGAPATPPGAGPEDRPRGPGDDSPAAGHLYVPPAGGDPAGEPGPPGTTVPAGG